MPVVRNSLLAEQVEEENRVNRLKQGNWLEIDSRGLSLVCYLQMTRIVLPQMLERKKGAIINISSLSGAIPTPLLTVYSGTKV